ncbi:uncharacterized protein BDZ99DRAFT_200684 [Mytilinidion resinicola]|uniref:Uncharacterized protein n=1 Tax=Mytilinidion resinicola TaxID=574789 RepID=A0A6A6Y3N7_9PEZI|nr:uncharacterized protein BDZ99DRAFT_200684 [Mytilinidion resinicola]KAF2802845.1 hypothetical protein BDZ99DRAFT_200684 [Mytilinidion resinicola]
MLPPTTPIGRPVSRWDFLPWPSVRERIIARKPVDDGDSSELEGYFGSQTTICWPYSLNEAITFAPPPDLVFGATGPYTITGCSGCKCSAPQLTDRFKLHLTRAQHWRLKPGSPQILKKYPEFSTIVL